MLRAGATVKGAPRHLLRLAASCGRCARYLTPSTCAASMGATTAKRWPMERVAMAVWFMRPLNGVWSGGPANSRTRRMGSARTASAAAA
eukprot:15446178-Alexandrium_andersonii.AAC.1